MINLGTKKFKTGTYLYFSLFFLCFCSKVKIATAESFFALPSLQSTPIGMVSSIEKDGEFLWALSENGLYKIAGTHSRKIQIDESKKIIGGASSISSSLGALWIVSYGNGLFKLDKQTEKLQRVTVNPQLDEYFWKVSSENNMVALAYLTGFVVFNTSNNEVIARFDTSSLGTDISEEVTSIQLTNKHVFATLNNLLISIELETGKRTTHHRDKSFTSISSIESLFVTDDLIAIAGKEGAYKIDRKTQSLQFLPFRNPMTWEIEQLFVDDKQRIWVSANGVSVESNTELAPTNFMQPFLSVARINTVVGFEQMPNGQMVLASTQSGIVVLPKQYESLNYASFFMGEFTNNIFSTTPISDRHSIIAADTGYFLMNNNNGVLTLLKEAEISASQLLTVNEGVAVDLTSCLAISPDNSVSKAYSLHEPNKLCGQDSKVFRNHKGVQLVLYQNNNKQYLAEFSKLGKHRRTVIAPLHSYIASINENGELVVVDGENRVLFYINDTWISYSSNSNNQFIFSCLIYLESTALFCTYDDGLGRIDQGGKVEYLSTALTADSRFIRDAKRVQDNILITSNRGMILADLALENARRIEKSYGIFDSDFNFEGIFNLNDNRLLVVGDKLTYLLSQSWYKPIQNPTTTNAKRIIVDNITTKNTLFNAPNLLTETDLIFPAEARPLSFTLSGTDISGNDPIDIEYRIVGKAAEWERFEGSRATISLPNIDHGDYRLEYRAIHKHSADASPTQSLSFTITPPFYLSTQAKLIYVVVCILAMSALVMLAIKRHEKNQEDKSRAVKSKLTALKDNTNSLQKLLEHKQTLMANISHEIRTPLMLVTEPLKTIFKEIKDEKLQQQYELISRNAGRVTALVEQLLEIERLSCLREIPSHNYDIHETATYVVESLRPLAEQKNQELTYKSQAKGCICLYQDTLQQIFYNLISNAVKYSPVDSTISVKTWLFNGSLMLSVKDEGPGLTAAEIKLMFDRFTRLQGAGNEPGIGIGLSLVKQLVRANGGHVDVVSQPGKGAEFKVALPLKNSNQAAPENPSVDAPTEDNAPTTTDKLGDYDPIMLIADDSNELRRYLHDLFAEDFRCFMTRNGQDAYDAACRIKPDVIITDYKMPKMSGVELTKAVRANEKLSHTAIFMLTGMCDSESIQSGHDAQVDEYIVKPFNQDILRQKIINRLSLNKNVMKAVSNTNEDDIEDDRQDFFSVVPKLTNEKDQLFYVKLRACFEKHACEQDFNREKCASLLNVCERQLNRKLEVVCGMSFTEALKLYRLFRAKSMLSEGCTVTDAAYDCGFSNPSYFSTVFKANFDVTPSDFASKVSTL